MVDTYKGVRDFYPEDKRIQTYLFSVMRRVVESYGYEEYDASLLEPTELYTAKTSEEIIRDQTYTFTDRGERSVTLRPEMTPTVARMVAARKRELGYPLRWYSIPNCFRYERPQKGRLREFWQLNVDLFGVEGVAADAESIAVAHRLLTAFGATESQFLIRVAHRGLLETAFDAAGLNDQAKLAYRMLLDKKPKMEPADFEREAQAITPTDIVHMITSGDNGLTEIRKELDQVLQALKTQGIGNVVFDPTIVRGFDYYTGVVFEIYDTSGENNRSLFGGGRYDYLVGEYGGDDVPAVGFAVSDVIIQDFLETHTLLPALGRGDIIYLAPVTADDVAAATEVADRLRTQGIPVALGMKHTKIGDHIRAAEKLGITHFTAFGEAERVSGMLEIKNLTTGETEKKKL